MYLNQQFRATLRAGAFALLFAFPTLAQTLGPNENETSLNGTNLTYYQRPAVAQCQNDCANNPNCKGFTWIMAGTYNRTDAAMCYLLSAVNGRSRTRGHVSGVKTTAAAPAGTEAGMSLTGTRLTYYQRPSGAQCQADCVNNPQCNGFTWIEPGTYSANDAAMCYLLSAVTGRSPARGHFSGVKQTSAGTGVSGGTPAGLTLPIGSFFWQWHACNDEYGLLIGINSTDGVNFTGGFENGNGSIKNGTVRGGRIEFDRESGWTQHYSGQLLNDGGKLKIVNGAWSGAYQEKCPGRLNWHAEKQ